MSDTLEPVLQAEEILSYRSLHFISIIIVFLWVIINGYPNEFLVYTLVWESYILFKLVTVDNNNDNIIRYHRKFLKDNE